MAKPTVILIAGGANSRFFPFQTFGHKGAFPLLGKPLIVRTLENLQQNGFEKVICVLPPKDMEAKKTEQLINAAKLSIQTQYIVQPEPKGMGDAVLHGVTNCTDEEVERFAVISAYHPTAGDMLSQMLEIGGPIVLASTKTAHPWEYGMLDFNDQRQAVNLVEKPEPGTEPSDQKVLTIYILNKQFINVLQKAEVSEYNFESALAEVIHHQPANVLQAGEMMSLKYPWQLFQFQKLFLSQLVSYRADSAQVAPTAVIDETLGPVHIGENVKVGHASRVVGPCYLGDNVIIGDFALVRGSSLEAESHVGCFSEVAKSIVGQDVHMHSGYVGDSIIGPHVRIGAGFVTANRRLDRQSIGVRVKGRMINTEMTSLGVFVGEKAHIGIQANSMPGKCVGPGVVVLPQRSITENLHPELQ